MRTVFATLTLFASVGVAGCAWLQSPQGKQIERQVLSDVQFACILEHSLLNVPAINEACQIDNALTPLVEDLLAAHRAAAKREASARYDALFAGYADGGARDGAPKSYGK